MTALLPTFRGKHAGDRALATRILQESPDVGTAEQRSLFIQGGGVSRNVLRQQRRVIAPASNAKTGDTTVARFILSNSPDVGTAEQIRLFMAAGGKNRAVRLSESKAKTPKKKTLFPNAELNLLSPGSGCPLQAGTGHGRPGRAPGRC
jgi:hypothetical protein